jgi:hypothetical protein
MTSLPTTKNDLTTTYTDQEVLNVSSEDGIYVDLGAMSPNYLAHQFKIRHSNNHDSMKITVAVKTSLSTVTSAVYLQVWNKTIWETLDTQNEIIDETPFHLVGRIMSNQGNYYDVVSDTDFAQTYDLNEITIRVYQYNL